MNNANDPTAAVYDIAFSQVKDDWLNQAELKLIQSLVSPGAKILDVGCGTGRHLIPLVQAGYQVTGIDVSAAMLAELAKKLPTANVIQGDILTHDFGTERFDLIIFMWNAFNEIALTEAQAEKLLAMGRILINSDDPVLKSPRDFGYEQEIKLPEQELKLSWQIKSFDPVTNITVAQETINDLKTEITQRWWSEAQLQELAEKSNLTLKHLPFNENEELYLLIEVNETADQC